MIVFDASTLILLAKAEILETFLEEAGQQIAIPAAVENECCGTAGSLDALLIQKAIAGKRIKVVAVKNRKPIESVLRDFHLGKGEAEALALAITEKAALLAIDDKQGINACKLFGIPFITAIGILVRMHQKGFIQRDEALSMLGALERYGRYKTEIVKDARAVLEGRR